jgi:hypothetical protein
MLTDSVVEQVRSIPGDKSLADQQQTLSRTVPVLKVKSCTDEAAVISTSLELSVGISRQTVNAMTQQKQYTLEACIIA